jgi:methyl-accepting chemotaxis protein
MLLVMLYLNDLLGQVDWKAVREWLSPLIAFMSVCWAIRESRLKRREIAARADDAKKYTEALATVIEYGRFVQHLEGVDKRVGDVADQLSQITIKAADIATKTAAIAETAALQTGEALKSLAMVSAAAKEVAEQLTQIGRTALRAQRDAVRAHKNLVGEITAEHS